MALGIRNVRNYPGLYLKRSRRSVGTSKTNERASAVSSITTETVSSDERVVGMEFTVDMDFDHP